MTRISKIAERIGISRYVVADIEKGKPTTAIVAYLSALWALGLLGDMREVGDPDRDEEGKILEQARSPKMAPKRSVLDERITSMPTKNPVAPFPQMRIEAQPGFNGLGKD